MTPIGILILNALVYSLIALYYYYKCKRINIGFFVLFLYAFCAWGSVLYYTHPLFMYFNDFTKITIEPFVYLLLVLLIYFYPILKFQSNKINAIELINEKYIFRLIYIVLPIQIIIYLALLPVIIKNFSGDLGAARDAVYDNANSVEYSNYFINILSRLYFGARNVIFIISLYGLIFIKKQRTLIILFFVSSLLFPIYGLLAYVSRAVIVIQILFSIYLLILLSNFIGKNLRSKITKYLLVILVPLVSIFTMISNSRFGEMANYMFIRYLGEPFVNFDTQLYPHLKNTTDGNAYFTLFKKLVGLDPGFKSTVDKWAYMDSITKIDTHIFYTFVGGFNIEFGFLMTLLIGLVISSVVFMLLKPLKKLTLSKLILIGMLGYTYINGAFFFVLQGDWGNLEILFTIFFYILFNQLSKIKSRTLHLKTL